MKKANKIIALLLASATATSMLSACGDNGDLKAKKGGIPEIEYFMPQDPGTELSDDTWVIKNWGEKTGVKIKLQAINRDVFNEKISALLAAGTIPDLINWRNGADDVEMYGSKLFVALDDYIDDGKLPNLQKWLEKYPEVREKGSTLDDGKMYGFPKILDFENINALWQVREDLLNEAGWKSEDIKTLDDLKAALLALKKVHGNRYLTSSYGWDYFARFTGYMFGTSPTIMFDNKVSTGTNKWVFGPKTENYKIWVEFFRWMYENQLIHPSFATMTQQELTALGSSGDLVLCIEQAAYANKLGGFNEEYPNRREGCIFPVEINGEVPKQPRLHHEDNTGRFPVTVSKTSEYIDDAMRAMDWLYSDEGHTETVYGKEGVDFVYDNNVTSGHLRLGKGYWYQKQKLKNGEITKEEYDALPSVRYLNNPWLYPVMDEYQRFGDYHKDDIYVKKSTEFVKANLQEAFDRGIVCETDPVVKFTEADGAKITDLNSILDTYVSEQSLKFIYGQISMDEWDSFVAELDRLGASELEKIYNDQHKKMFG